MINYIAETIFEAVVEVLKFIFWYLIWCYALFSLGWVFLLLVTLGKYPRGKKLEKDVNFIAGVGLGVLFSVWASIAIYNNWGGIVGAST